MNQIIISIDSVDKLIKVESGLKQFINESY